MNNRTGEALYHKHSKGSGHNKEFYKSKLKLQEETQKQAKYIQRLFTERKRGWPLSLVSSKGDQENAGGKGKNRRPARPPRRRPPTPAGWWRRGAQRELCSPRAGVKGTRPLQGKRKAASNQVSYVCALCSTIPILSYALETPQGMDRCRSQVVPDG